MNRRSTHSAVCHSACIAAADATGAVYAGDLVAACQGNIVHRPHIVSHNAANGHGEDVSAGDGYILNGQVLDLTHVHADHAYSANRIVRGKGHIGYGVSLAVKGTKEHAAVIAHIFKIHVTNGLPGKACKVNVRRQSEKLSRIALRASIIDLRGKRKQLLRRCNLIGIIFCTGSTRKKSPFCGCSGAQDHHQAQYQECGYQLLHGKYLPFFVCMSSPKRGQLY